MGKEAMGICLAFCLCALSACGKSEPAGAKSDFSQDTAEGTTLSENLETVYLVSRERLYGNDGTMYEKRRYDYDENGNKIREGIFDGDGELDSFYEYEYDAFGNNIKQIEYYWKSSPISVIFEYDTNGKKTKSTSYTAQGVMDSCTEYDADGNETKWMIYNDDGSVCESIESEYDAYGNKTSDYCYTADGSIKWAYNFEYEYDTNGNMIKEMSYDRFGGVRSAKQYEYDTSGNMMKETHYDAAGVVRSTTQYEYNSNGDLTKETNYSVEGSIMNGYENMYDADGNVIKHIEFGPDGDTSFENQDQIWNMTYDINGNEIRSEITDANGYENKAIETEYDANGNIIKCTRYELGSVNGWEEYEYIAIQLPKDREISVE